jgi:hypothetical protein
LGPQGKCDACLWIRSAIAFVNKGGINYSVFKVQGVIADIYQMLTRSNAALGSSWQQRCAVAPRSWLDAWDSYIWLGERLVLGAERLGNARALLRAQGWTRLAGLNAGLKAGLMVYLRPIGSG